MDEEESTGEERVKNFICLLAQYVRETDAQEKPQLEAGLCRKNAMQIGTDSAAIPQHNPMLCCAVGAERRNHTDCE